EHDTRVWRVVEHHVRAAREGLDFSGVTDVGMDETSARRGQDYVSIFMDLDQRRVMFATPGKDAETVKAFAADLGIHGGRPQTQVERVCADMSPAFLKRVNEYLSEQPAAQEQEPQEPEGAGADTPEAEQAIAVGELHRPQVVFDRFHVVAKANEAVGGTRRAEGKTRPELKLRRDTWLKRESNLSVKQAERLTWLTRPSMRLKTTRAARWRDGFNGFYEQPTRQDAEVYLKRWCYGAKRCRLEPVKEFARMVEAHWEGIIAWQESQLSNGLLEGTNSLVQAAKRRARGYRSKDKMITIIYLIAGKLPLPEIHTDLARTQIGYVGSGVSGCYPQRRSPSGRPGASLRPAPLRTGYVEFNINGCMSLARLCGRPACRSGISRVVYGFGGSGVPHNRGCASRLLGSSSAI